MSQVNVILIIASDISQSIYETVTGDLKNPSFVPLDITNIEVYELPHSACVNKRLFVSMHLFVLGTVNRCFYNTPALN